MLNQVPTGYHVDNIWEGLESKLGSRRDRGCCGCPGERMGQHMEVFGQENRRGRGAPGENMAQQFNMEGEKLA